MLRKKTLANLEMASWFKPRRGKNKHVKRNKPMLAMRSVHTPSIKMILKEQARRKSNEAVKVVEVESANQLDKPLLPMNNFKDTRVSRDGTTSNLLQKNS